jgi:imidazoleglycerol phosphate dehydratase HisB
VTGHNRQINIKTPEEVITTHHTITNDVNLLLGAEQALAVMDEKRRDVGRCATMGEMAD